MTIIAVMLCMISVSTAQTTMEWSDYKIQFTFSEDLQEMINTSDNFVAASPSKDFVISLGPCDYSGVDEKTMGKLLTQTALQDLGIKIHNVMSSCGFRCRIHREFELIIIDLIFFGKKLYFRVEFL